MNIPIISRYFSLSSLLFRTDFWLPSSLYISFKLVPFVAILCHTDFLTFSFFLLHVWKATVHHLLHSWTVMSQPPYSPWVPRTPSSDFTLPVAVKRLSSLPFPPDGSLASSQRTLQSRPRDPCSPGLYHLIYPDKLALASSGISIEDRTLPKGLRSGLPPPAPVLTQDPPATRWSFWWLEFFELAPTCRTSDILCIFL